MQNFVNYRDKYGSELFARQLSDNQYSCALDGANAASIAVPAGAKYCIIGGANFWVSKTGNPVLPAANTFSASNCEFEASVLYVYGLTTLYFNADVATKISVGFYN